MFFFGCGQYFFAVKIDAYAHRYLVNAQSALSIGHDRRHKTEEGCSRKYLLRYIMPAGIPGYFYGIAI